MGSQYPCKLYTYPELSVKLHMCLSLDLLWFYIMRLIFELKSALIPQTYPSRVVVYSEGCSSVTVTFAHSYQKTMLL